MHWSGFLVLTQAIPVTDLVSLNFQTATVVFLNLPTEPPEPLSLAELAHQLGEAD